MTTKRATYQNRKIANNRKYNYTAAQIKALESVFGKAWTKLSKAALDNSLITLGL